MSAFQMLSLDDADDDNENMKSDSDEEEIKPKFLSGNKAAKQQPQDDAGSESVPATSKAKKKGKGKEKKAEEDIDALLAEIESKPVAKGKKKKGKMESETKNEEDEMADNEPEADSIQVERQDSAEKEEKKLDLNTKDISEMTQDEIAAWLDNDDYEEEDKKSKRKKKKQKEKSEPKDEDDGKEIDTEESSIKSAAQKKKEKKERQKQQKAMEKSQPKKQPDTSAVSADVVSPEMEEKHIVAETIVEKAEIAEGEDDEPKDEVSEETSKKKKKKEKAKKGAKKEEEEEKKKKPSKMARAIQEMQQKIKDEEERLQREEEERERMIEEKRRLKEEQERKEAERKEREKQKKKDKIERLKAEGKYLTQKQKEDRRRAEQMLESLKAQGVDVPSIGGEKLPKKAVVYSNKKKKKPDQKQQKEEVTPTETLSVTPIEEKTLELQEEEEAPQAEEESKDKEEPLESWEEVADSWEHEADDQEDVKKPTTPTQQVEKPKTVAKEVTPVAKVERTGAEVEGESDEENSDEESSDESEESEESSSDDEDLTPRERAIARIQKRKQAAAAACSTDNLRAPVVCVLGHVDTGKTKILDKLRRTHVQDDEAGGITQQIGATNVPADKISEQTKMCKEFAKNALKIPGLLIIDTPGHESFSNLRTRGSSLCDIAILVIDIMHGLEPQTIESINLLKKGKTPFIVALNKVDRLFQWQSNPNSDIVNTIKKQKTNTKQEFDERVTIAVVQLAEQGLNACLFYENKNPREYVSMVPTSAHSGDGMGNLIALICELTQTMLAKRIAFSEELQATVMEVKAIQGLGTTIDVILVNGYINESDTIIIAGQEGPIVTQVRAILMPQPMKELRVKNAYSKFKTVTAAQGCKIIAKDLEKALAGLPLYVAHKQDEIDYYKEEISNALGEILASIKLQDRGVFVQASTLGSLEALLEFLRTSKIPYSGINIGPVHRKDIMKASIMLEHDPQLAVILAFDVKVEREAQEMAESLGVRIFSADIIYHLFDQFMAHRDQQKKKKQEEFKHIAVFPCKLRILPQYVFKSRDPIVCGVIVEAGFIKEGMPLCVPSKDFCDLGRVTSIENNHKTVDKATKGQEVCIKIESIPGDAPKLFGRHFDETDAIYSKISRQSIDAVKDYFRDEMKKEDWQLIIEMKKLFEIL